MKARNSFPEESRLIFQDLWMCYWCGENTADALHHIVGRGNTGSVVESSIYNAAPLCNQKCHLKHHGELRTEEMMKAMLVQTKKYLDSKGYKPNRIDSLFLIKYAKYYRKAGNPLQ